MFCHRAVVGIIVRSDTKQLVTQLILSENLEDNRGKVVASVMVYKNFKSEKWLMQIEIFIDIMASNRYTE